MMLNIVLAMVEAFISMFFAYEMFVTEGVKGTIVFSTMAIMNMMLCLHLLKTRD